LASPCCAPGSILLLPFCALWLFVPVSSLLLHFCALWYFFFVRLRPSFLVLSLLISSFSDSVHSHFDSTNRQRLAYISSREAPFTFAAKDAPRALPKLTAIAAASSLSSFRCFFTLAGSVMLVRALRNASPTSPPSELLSLLSLSLSSSSSDVAPAFLRFSFSFLRFLSSLDAFFFFWRFELARLYSLPDRSTSSSCVCLSFSTFSLSFFLVVC
jgi:hypothetical protein